MSNRDRTVLVSGATGSQGGAVARELLARGFRVRALTRKPEGDKARELAALGADVVAGDLDDAASLERALAGAWGTWAVQNTWEAGVEREEEQGHRFARAAKAAGVQHFVYTSVGSADRNTGIPHFENKWRVEKTVRALGFPSHAILRPVFFMENLLSPWFLNGDHLVSTLPEDTKLQMVAVEDIGRFGAMLFERAEELDGLELQLAGDAVTLPRAAAVVSGIVGRPLTYQRIPLDAVRQDSADFAAMLEWFEREGYNADIRGIARVYGVTPLTLEAWAARKRA